MAATARETLELAILRERTYALLALDANHEDEFRYHEEQVDEMLDALAVLLRGEADGHRVGDGA